MNHSNNPSVQKQNLPEHPYSWANVPSELLSLFSENIHPATKRNFMAQAISEARKSDFLSTVGSVIVKNNRIIARGYRQVKKLRDVPPLWRMVHAEQAALRKAGNKASGATLYVTLEPCAGRFEGPTVEAAEVCSAIIPQAGISTVVIGLVDRDPKTFGKGIKKLHEAGVQLEYAYQGLESELVELIGDGQFGVMRPKILTVLRKWMSAWQS